MPEQTRLVVGPNESGNVQLGSTLHRLRDKARLSRAEAAGKVNLSSEYLRLIETGKRTPAMGTMRMVLKAYGVVYHVDDNVVIFDTFVVEFTSRIQEARSKFPDPAVENRDAIIGEIVRLLVTADDRTLRSIRKTLRK